MVIGCCGAGKTTLARQIQNKTGLPLIHLDRYYWKPGWKESDTFEWEKTVHKLASEKNWIIDGNYGGTMGIRISQADTIIYLIYSTLVCLIRVIIKILMKYGNVRSEMPPGCPERFDWKFLHYVATFQRRKGKKLLKILTGLPTSKQTIILHNKREVQTFLAKLPSPPY